jgi:hypothetical protein
VRRFFKRAAFLLAVAIAGTTALLAWKLMPGRHAEVHLEPLAENAAPRSVLTLAPFYLQTDAKWARDKIGGSGEDLRAVGCTICCLSMALAQHGIQIDPGELNRKFKEADGYTSRGWIK